MVPAEAIGRNQAPARHHEGAHMYLGRNRRRLAGVAALAAAAVLAVGCSSSGAPPSSGGGTKVKGGTATFAEEPGTQPNWIWPFTPLTHASAYGAQDFQWLMDLPP